MSDTVTITWEQLMDVCKYRGVRLYIDGGDIVCQATPKRRPECTEALCPVWRDWKATHTAPVDGGGRDDD